MATTAAMSLMKPIIPIQSMVKEEDFIFTTLSTTTQVHGQVIKKKYDVPKFSSEEVEHILRCVQEFDQAVKPENLNCENNGPKLYRLSLQGILDIKDNNSH